ncbi:MAG: hypothetical protein JNL30_08265 [Rubrivivax sp.]|nr:hypothetical protein [Rubrivivax sp.]
MPSLDRWLSPVRRLATAFFRSDLTLHRERGQVHVALAERPAAAAPPPARQRDEVGRRRRHEELMLIRAELAALLNELPETRSTMRHLVFVEQALEKKGLKVLHKVPLDVLRRAHEQLENLVINWSPAGLASLRSKMAVAIIDREHMDPEAEADAYRTAAVMDAASRAELEAPPTIPVRSDEEALAAAYAVLAQPAAEPPTLAEVEMQGELGSASARALRRPTQPAPQDAPGEISIRVLQP